MTSPTTPRPELTLRRAAERGHADHGWLDSWHSFSFADYHDPAHMGFRSLRVINQDRVAPGGGFPTHPHRNMEIFSYVLEGALAHRDSLGHERILHPGEIQLMSAGSGVTHSEYNPSASAMLHFLQIWILPRQANLSPDYTEWRPRPEHADAAQVLLISPDGQADSAKIQQDAYVYRLKLRPGQRHTLALAPQRGAWLQLINGHLQVGETRLAPSDAASWSDSAPLTIEALEEVEALFFDLA